MKNIQDPQPQVYPIHNNSKAILLCIVIMGKEGSHRDLIHKNKMVSLQTFLNYVFINQTSFTVVKKQMVLKIFLMSFLKKIHV